jgi:hypothetical protein
MSLLTVEDAMCGMRRGDRFLVCVETVRCRNYKNRNNFVRREQIKIGSRELLECLRTARHFGRLSRVQEKRLKTVRHRVVAVFVYIQWQAVYLMK